MKVHETTIVPVLYMDTGKSVNKFHKLKFISNNCKYLCCRTIIIIKNATVPKHA